MLRWTVLVVVLPLLTTGFPDGAPIDACVKPRPNQPYHGQAKPQTGHLPYDVVASASQYGPGSHITLTIEGLQGTTFRGFFMQARDGETGAWIGTWKEAENTKGLPECSAITHGDNRDKLQATLVWTAPRNSPGGHVYFTGSVVKNYSTFWVDIIPRVG